jgi:CDP-diacylglycerol--glycerol-3-phosphate 3-phosphatidyltransferase
MNTPNKLTVIRVVLIPFFVLFLMTDFLPASQLWALAVFAIASFTDFLDGYLARRDHLVTNFGKLMDPLADKLLVTAALICFVEIGLAPAWVVIIIISREFLVTSIRLVAAGEGKVIAADKSGKYKTATQMVWVCYAILLQYLAGRMALPSFLWGLHYALMAAVVVLTVYSGMHYVLGNREFFAQ